MSGPLAVHLATGATTVCRCWRIDRADGVRLGFTDHDRDLIFEDVVFRADTGMTARSLSQSTGLSVDNTEALGILSDAAVTEADIAAGRYDGAEVRSWLVNWARPGERELRFRGTLGEIVRGGGAFHAELRGLAEALNQPVGRAYQPVCDAVLGDAACRFDLTAPGFRLEADVAKVEGAVVSVPDMDRVRGFFRHGRLEVLGGAAAGLSEMVREDGARGGLRHLTLWQALRADLKPGDRVRLTAGCDGQAATCRGKFGNFLNFRGFPHVPGEDWLAAVPRSGEVNDGGRRDG
ncbi:DUF2163 domain-containing protein [Histidinibacterium lentulum]|uniref:DUF2163 domain-containing protein n=1 Tax=Histidinibacterium lentulum TaxID=2480588 RepID=A0A3N2R4Y1_9RHOB|nr:DUF2163 domain-containing protein [Histidinibacterium lentulum]ROU02406.1 DUF2163 domain-containing protein [Histidinibacterium lentulum]